MRLMVADPRPGGPTAGARPNLATRIPWRLVLAAAPLVLFVAAGVLAPVIAPGGPGTTDLSQSLRAPGWQHLLGTDQLGRDQAVRLLYAARTSLAVTGAVLGIAVTVGVLAGTAAGYAGGIVDRVAQRLVELALSMPTLVVALAVLGIRGNGTGNVVLALAVFAWAPYARIARGVVASRRRSPAVDALRVLGARQTRILGRHLLPEAVRPALVYASTDVGTVVLATASLSFLGLGVSPSTPEWGRMLVESRPFLATALWLALAPGVAVTMVVVAANLLGEHLATPPAASPARTARRRQQPEGTRIPEAVRLCPPDRPTSQPKGTHMTEPVRQCPPVHGEGGEAAFAVEGLRVAFPAAAGTGWSEVVHGVTFSVGGGRTLAVVGGSGSGKTVSVLGPLGLLPGGAAVVGSARLAGTELIGMPERELRGARGRRIGVVFQDPYASLNPLRTVGAQVGEAVRNASPGMSRSAVRRCTVDLLGEVGLPDPARVATRHPHELSGGMRQRALIAAALAARPELLIADEPTSALDVTVQAQILLLLRRLVVDTGMAMILISHDLAVVAELADEIAVMADGRIVEYGPAARLLAEPAADATRDLLAAAPRVEHRTERTGVPAGTR